MRYVSQFTLCILCTHNKTNVQGMVLNFIAVIVDDSLVKKKGLGPFESYSSNFDFNHTRYVNEMYSISMRMDLLERLYPSLLKYASYTMSINFSLRRALTETEHS